MQDIPGLGKMLWGGESLQKRRIGSLLSLFFKETKSLYGHWGRGEDYHGKDHRKKICTKEGTE